MRACKRNPWYGHGFDKRQARRRRRREAERMRAELRAQIRDLYERMNRTKENA